ncbi:MAG: hypothetical protein MK135_04970 [Polyangiaceae bacterium]|nr:hypothetical protein [Polyangiaceae bacterium]
MPRPFKLLDEVTSDEGPLQLLQRGELDFMILVNGRVLMTSMITESELALAKEGCAVISRLPRPKVLIGGMGLGFTLRAALDALAPMAQVVVAELNPQVVEWCRGPAAIAADGAALDPRVSIYIGGVTKEIHRVAEDKAERNYDAILWDLYVGPTRQGGERDPLYGSRSITRTFAALSPGGVFGIWGETPSPAFEARLRRAGFEVKLLKTGGKGLKHAVYLATRPSVTKKTGPRPIDSRRKS